MRSWRALICLASAAMPSAGLAEPGAKAAAPHRAGVTGCPREMVRVHDFCVDRWEISCVDAETGQALSPYYPPHPRLTQRVREVWEIERHNFGDESARAMPLPALPGFQRRLSFTAKAVSAPGVVPQGYLTYFLAEKACTNAGKRLCSENEWLTACQGAKQTRFPYGANYEPDRCNVHRRLHPAFILHANSSAGHTDPRLNLIDESGRDPLLRLTGATEGCASRWGNDALLDMVGNLDEWIADEGGVFVGSFYARATTEGCVARIASHAPQYYDYSLGTRCCRAADPQ